MKHRQHLDWPFRGNRRQKEDRTDASLRVEGGIPQIARRTESLKAQTKQVGVEVNLRPTVSRPACPGVRRTSGTHYQFYFLLEISFRQLRLCYIVAPSLTRGRVCNLPVQLLLGLARALLGRSPAELTAIFYCLI
jgi:hypothetical protein